MTETSDITALLVSWRKGDAEALDRLLPLARTELNKIARRHPRTRGRVKRGGDAERLSLDAGAHLSREQLDDVVAIDIALDRLAERDPAKSQIFEMRFFGGLTIEETAEALGASESTVVRGWRLACAWLRRELGEHGANV